MKLRQTLLTLILTTSILSSYGQFTAGDITYTPIQSSFIHDSTTCSSFVTYDHFVQISNSFIGDEIEVKDFGGQTIYSETNTSGDVNWMVNIPLMDMDDIGDEYVVNGNLDGFVPSQIYKFICDNDTLYTSGGHSFSEPVNDACIYSSIGGKIYIDNNNDCNFNVGDSVITGMAIQPNTVHSNTPSNYGAWDVTDQNGDYQITIQESWFTSYSIAINPSYQFIFPNSNCTPFAVTSTMLPNPNIDFVLECAALDTWVSAGNGPVHAALPFKFFPSVANIGCDTVSGTLAVVLDPNVTYSAANSTNPADYVIGDTLFWNYSGLNNVTGGGYWNTFSGGIELLPNVNVNIGDTLCFELITGVPNGDINTANNVAEVCLPVVAAYDPNIKTVSPQGYGPEGFISDNVSKLTYTVHFQNTGNAEAINVRLRDTLEANILPSTLRIIDASHSMNPEWIDQNVLDFKFNNIYLPDSTTDQAGSRGFVKFEVDIEQGLIPGTEIKNRAHIYFDNNPAIITDYALNTIEDNASVSLEDLESLVLYPNPAEGSFEVSSSFKLDEIVLLTLEGKVLNRVETNKMNISNIPSGLYMVRIKRGDIYITRKLVKR